MIMLEFFNKNFPLFKITKEGYNGLNSLIKMNYGGFYVTIQFMDISQREGWNPYLDVYLGVVENEDMIKIGSYDRDDILEKIYKNFKDTKYYVEYEKELRIKKLNRIL